MKSILIFSEFYHPELSSGYYIQEIAEKLALTHRVTVITTGDDSEQSEETKNQVHIIRMPEKGLNKNNLVQRFFKFTYVSLQFFLIGRNRLDNTDEVICVTNPALFVPVIALLKKGRAFKLSLFAHDVFPENLVATRILKSKSLLYRFILWVYNKSYLQADQIVACGRDMKLLFERKLINFRGDVAFIPNWGDPNLFFPDDELGHKILKGLGIERDFVFQFSGNLGRGQGIDCLLAAITKMDTSQAHFLFFGDGLFKEKLIEQSHNKNLTYAGVYTRDQSGQFLNACDVAIVSLQDGMLGLGVPSKTYNILSVGKPILYIGDEASEVALLVKEQRIGFICKSGDADSIVKGFHHFLSMSLDGLAEMSQRARKVSLLYSKQRILEKYDLIYSGK